MQNLIDLAKRQIDWQMEALDAIDAKATGLLAFDGALAAGILLLEPRLGLWQSDVVCLLALSAIGCVMALWIDRSDIGPDVTDLYGALGQGSGPEVDAKLLAELASAVYANRRPIERKTLSWKAAAWVVLASVVVMVASVLSGRS